MANNLIQVSALAEDSIVVLSQALTFAALTDRRVRLANTPGQRGTPIQRSLPTQFSVVNSLAPSFSDMTYRKVILPINDPMNVSFKLTSTELATYPQLSKSGAWGKSEISRNAEWSMRALAQNIDAMVAQTIALGTYRWYGDLNPTSSSTILTYQGLTQALSYFRSFSDPNIKCNCVLPISAATAILNTMNQQFTPETNDRIMNKAWRIPSLAADMATDFYKSNLLPVHTAGTASANGEMTISSITTTTYTWPGSSITYPASVINLSGLTSGQTILAGDVGDIGTATSTSYSFNEQNPIKFLDLNGHNQTIVNPQFLVVTGGTADGSGNISFTVVPQFIFDSNNVNPARNISRAISTSTDKLRIVGDHCAATVFFQDYAMMDFVEMENTDPFPSKTVYEPELEMSIRAYHGTEIGAGIEPTQYFVYDTLFGSFMVPEGGMRIILPTNFGQYGS